MRTGIWIPEWINKLGLNGNMKLLYAEIVSLSKNGCFASNQHFAEVLGLKPDTVSRMISTLKKNGFIAQAGFDGRKRTLVPLKVETSYSAPAKAPIENRLPIQSRVGESSKTVLDFPTKSCTKVQLKKNEINIKRIQYIQEPWEKFLEFALKLSDSTFSKLKAYKNPESLPKDLRIYYERFLNVA